MIEPIEFLALAVVAFCCFQFVRPLYERDQLARRLERKDAKSLENIKTLRALIADATTAAADHDAYRGALDAQLRWRQLDDDCRLGTSLPYIDAIMKR